MSLIIAILFAIILEPFSFLIWAVFFFIGNSIGKKLFSTLPTKIDFSLVYGFVSIIGLIICIDNFYNFNSLTGFALDDDRFLKATKYLVGQSEKPQMEVSFFSYVLLIIAYPVSFLK